MNSSSRESSPSTTAGHGAPTPHATIKAWYVEDGWGESAVIVFAATRNQARHKGAGRLDAEYRDVSATRRPVYDELAPAGPTDERLFDDGWWFDCCRCGARSHKDSGGAIVAGRFYCEDHLPDGVGGAPRPAGSGAQAEHREDPNNPASSILKAVEKADG